MKPLLDLLESSVTRRLPAWAREGSAEEARRARLLLWFALVFQGQAVLFTVFYAAIRVPAPAVIVAVAGVASLGLPAALRRGSEVATHFLCVLLLLALDGIAVWTGGLHAPALWWTALLPAVATLGAGRRVGLQWLGVAGGNTLLFVVAGAAGLTPASALPPWAMAPLLVLAVTMMGFVIWALSSVHEHTREEMVARLDASNREMHRVLDNVGQGYLVADRDGRPSPEHSAILHDWFGPFDPTRPLWRWIDGDARFRDWMELGWEAVFDGFLPTELCLDQLPNRVTRNGRVFGLTFRAIGTQPDAIIVVVTDVTTEVEAHRAEARMHEHATITDRLRRDPSGFLQFWDDSVRLIRALSDGGPAVPRDLHTLKGNCAVFGLTSVAEVCQAIETELADQLSDLSPEQAARVERTWREVTEPARGLVERERAYLGVPIDDFTALERAIAEQWPHRELACMVASWRSERTADSLARLGERAVRVASAAGKSVPRLSITDHDLRLDPTTWAPLWQAFIHAIRNAVDHGIEAPEVRAAAGKDPVATLELCSERVGDRVVVSVSDDGGGVDWDRVAARAAALGLPHATEADCVAALFADGFSTAEAVSDVSGRGVGLSALRATVEAMGGTVTLRSTHGRGTTIEARLPAPVVMVAAA